MLEETEQSQAYIEGVEVVGFSGAQPGETNVLTRKTDSVWGAGGTPALQTHIS